MDARWTEEDNQACEQEVGLLSTAVGHDAGVGHLKRVKFSTNRMFLALSDTEQILRSGF